MNQPFDNRVAIITGASAGIGRAVALRLADQGARLALAARDAARLDALAEDCRRRGGQALAVPTDVSDEVHCRRLIDRTCETYGQIDMLVNNAGIGVGGWLSDLPDLRLFRQVMDVNFYGQVQCAYHALPHLRESRGRIVAISSLGGKFPLPGNTSYTASKFGLQGFYDSLRMELAGSGVSITVVCPYWVVTEFHERQMNVKGQAKGPAGRAIYTKRMMTADRCAEITLKAAAARRREVLMGPGALAAWARMMLPGLVDWMTIKFFLEPAIRRARAGKAG